ncbi:FAD/NAD(P)-binding domain-containing protein [Saccharata proteae CBS 121410]|uniref:FAD/NAD(P)-binding domain-containing protein n=1 Tax=Saccharata proteae CBS 121410 TaxID=1314787 RepID=A0A9P4I0V9_9PEZI|nr:FAD/NAD(P)-binding domain-containing protein [Saccharata proteae CBS 121410]
MSQSLKVVIVGAGLGGLACAIACRRQGLQVVLLERAPQILPIGAGIQVPPNASRALQRLGLLERVREKGTQLESITVRRYQDGSLLCEKMASKIGDEDLGLPWVVIHRADYHEILVNEAKALGVDVRLGVEVEKIDFESTTLHVKGEDDIKGDVMVGADGLWSSIRDSLLGFPSPPTPTGDLAYRGTFSLDQLLALGDPNLEALCKKKTQTIWFGPNKHVVFYPIRRGTEFNMVLLCADDLPPDTKTMEGDIGEMRASFEGWDPILTKIITCIPSVLKWKLCHHEELPTWTKNCTALLGDACHPTLPYQAQGAAMAINDGCVLGKLLGSYNHSIQSQPTQLSSTHNIPSLLQLYERLRKSRTTLNVRGAIRNQHFYHMPDGEEQRRRDEQLKSTEWKGLRDEYSFVDTDYQKDLLGEDAIGNAEKAFKEWLA